MANLFYIPVVSGYKQKLFRLYFTCTERKAVMDALSPVATILVVKKFSKVFFFMLPFASSFKIFIYVLTFLYVKANSKEIGEEILFSSLFQKNADVSIFVEIQG